MRSVRAAASLAVVVALAGWTLTTGASYSLVSHLAHIKPVTAVATDRHEVGVLVDAPSSQIPVLAGALAGYGIHPSFAVAQPSGAVVTDVSSYGDQSLPRLPNGGLVRWMGARGQLRKLIELMGYRRHFLYASTGPSLGQWLVAHGAGGRLVAGAVQLQDARDSLGNLRPGEVVEVNVASGRYLPGLIGRLLSGLRQRHLAAVSVGRLLRDGDPSD